MLAAKLALTALAAAPAPQSAILPPVAAAAVPLAAQTANSEAIEPELQVPDAPLGDLSKPATANVKADPSASLDDIDLAAPKPFPDPFEPINRISYAVTQPIDRLVLRPLAMSYQAVVPKPGRDGARNAIANVSAPVVFINDMLQLRPDRAIRTLGRFLINSTIGAFGLFDIARRKPFNLTPHSNSFGNTLGYYGIGPVAYLYLPVLGPTTVRDTGAQFGDGFIRERMLDKALYPDSGRRLLRDDPDLGTPGTIVTVVEGLDLRAENDFDMRTMQEDSVDPYAALRANFMQDRAGEIAGLKAKEGEAVKAEGFDDPLVDPEP